MFPIEVLHTFQLGILKYLTTETMNLLGQNSGIQAMVESFDFTALPYRMNGIDMLKVEIVTIIFLLGSIETNHTLKPITLVLVRILLGWKGV